MTVAALRRVLVPAVLAVLALLAVPAPASAHAALVGTVPAQGQVVDAAPAEVVLTFTEHVNPVSGRVRVIGPDSTRVDKDDARSQGNTLVIPLRDGLDRGTYLVNYRVISSDSHPVAGAFTFSIIAPSPGGPPTATDNAARISPTLRTVFPIVRWVGYAGLLLLVGSVIVLIGLWPQRLSRTGPLRLTWLGAGLVAMTAILELILQIPYVTGVSLGSISKADAQDVFSSQFGAAHLTRLAVVAVSVFLIRTVVKGGGWAADRVLLAVLAVIGLATWPLSGHPGASPVPLITVLADMIHLSAMSTWLGGLAVLFVFLLPRASAPELGAIVPVWSRWATYAVSALVLTGVAQALVEVGTVDGLIKTRYGWLVLGKIGLVAVVASVASLARRLVLPAAEEVAGTGLRLRRIVAAEATVAAVILGVTSVLVQTTPGRTATAPATVDNTQNVTLTSQYFSLSVQVTPAQAGINQVHMVAFGADGKPISILEWQGKASLPAEGIEPIPIDMVPLAADHATGQVTLPTPGTWTFTFTLRVSDVNQSSASAQIPIAPG